MERMGIRGRREEGNEIMEVWVAGGGVNGGMLESERMRGKRWRH